MRNCVCLCVCKRNFPGIRDKLKENSVITTAYSNLYLIFIIENNDEWIPCAWDSYSPSILASDPWYVFFGKVMSFIWYLEKTEIEISQIIFCCTSPSLLYHYYFIARLSPVCNMTVYFSLHVHCFSNIAFYLWYCLGDGNSGLWEQMDYFGTS